METEAENAANARGSSSGDAWREKVRVVREMEDDWQHYRTPVLDTATPASELETIARALLPDNASLRARFAAANRQLNRADSRFSGGGICVLEAIAAHPNTPPRLLEEIMEAVPDNEVRGIARAVCRNPILPFLLLEAPDFPVTLGGKGQLALLGESSLPTTFIALMRRHTEPDVQEAAGLHVAGAGDVRPRDDWQEMLRGYWREFCTKVTGRQEREEHHDLVEMGLAPPWAVVEPVPLPSRPAHYPFLEEWFRARHAPFSSEEAAMLKQIGPGIWDKAALARGLQANATPNDLVRLMNQENTGRGLVIQAIFRHPNTNEWVLKEMANSKNCVPLRDLAQHERAGSQLLIQLLGKDDPTVRRLARRHPNAPPNTAELSHRSFALRRFHDGLVSSAPTLFVSFVASLHFGAQASADVLARRVESVYWTERLEAVLIAAQNPDALKNDFASRTTNDLLHHLAWDGNRLVRAAARAFLADPNTRFVL